jgi:hypothetical protein
MSRPRRIAAARSRLRTRWTTSSSGGGTRKRERDRDLGKEIDEANGDAVLIADKQRNGEWNGRIALWFNRRGMTFRGQIKDDAQAALDLGMRQPGEDGDGE